MTNDPSYIHQDEQFDGESSVRSLFDETRCDGPPVDFDEWAARRQHRSNRFSRNTWLNTSAAIAMSGLLACSVAAVFIVGARPASTFAQVQAKVAATKSVSYVIIPLKERANDDLNYANAILSEGKHRIGSIERKLESAAGDDKMNLEQELQKVSSSVAEAESYLAQRGDLPPERVVFVLGRYRQREESKSVGGDIVDVVNMRTGKSIRLNKKSKIATIFTRQITLDGKGGKSEQEITETPDLTVDFYARIRNVPKDATRLNDMKMIGKRKHIGFQVSEVDGPYTWTRTFWVDTQSQLPSQIDIRARSEDKRYGPSDAVIKDIRFDVPFDESLFDTNIPEGYQLQNSSLMNIELE